MATFTSTTTGDWDDGATWGNTSPGSSGVDYPGASDTAIISVGDVVDYTADLTHTGPITVHGTLRGDGARVLTLSNVALTLKAGGAITNTGGVFEIKIGGAHFQASAVATLGEASGSRATVTGESTTNHIKFTHGSFINGGKCTVQRVDFSKVGNSSTAAFAFYGSTGDTFSWTSCTFDADCGRIQNFISLGAAAVFVFEDNLMLATGQNMTTSLSGAAKSGGTRSIQRNWFAGSLGTLAGTGQWYDVLIKHNVILGGLFCVDSADQPWDSGSGFNVIRIVGTNALVVKATTSVALPWYLHIHNPSASITNSRGLTPTGRRDITIAGWIIEPGDTDSTGDVIFSANPPAARAYVIEHNLLLPNKDDDRTGQFVSSLGGANLTYTSINNNTWISDNPATESGAISYGETYAGHTDLFGAIKSNLVWSPASGGGYVFQRRNIGTVADACASANVTNNGKWNLSTGDYGLGYDDTIGTGMFSSGSPGTNDVTVSADPFVDRTRRISTWAVARGYSVASDYATRQDDAYTALKTDIDTRIEDLFTYVQDGWKVTDASLETAGHDSGTIGALAYVQSGNPYNYYAQCV